MSKLKPVTCACCGADITAPQFYNGKAYGWSCVLKQSGSFKRTKDTGLWLQGKIIKVETENARLHVLIEVLGKKLWVSSYFDQEAYAANGEYLKCLRTPDNFTATGLIRISRYKHGGTGSIEPRTFELITEPTGKSGKMAITSIRTTTSGLVTTHAI